MRAQAIRLSDAKHSVDEIAEFCQATRKTVAGWIDKWEKHEFDSLIEKPRTGRKTHYPTRETF